MADTENTAEIRTRLGSASERTLSKLIKQYADDDRQGVRDAIDVARRRLAAIRAERRRIESLYALENELREQGLVVIAGVDEVGRGSLAGPLSCAVVILPADPRIEALDDSKRILPERRREVAMRVREVALSYSIAHLPAPELDALGMTRALRAVIGQALATLDAAPLERLLLDGLPLGVIECETAIVGGDRKVAAIAAASVIAKVARDDLMCELDDVHPGWGFAEHKGYSTPEHIAAIARLGLSPEHRRSFAPCGGTISLF